MKSKKVQHFEKPDEFWNDFGKKLKLLRIQKGWTQPDLEKASGISQASISRIEAGKERCLLQTKVKLYNALEIDDDSNGNLFQESENTDMSQKDELLEHYRAELQQLRKELDYLREEISQYRTSPLGENHGAKRKS